ncbi:MAG: hypothetical protein P0Y49_21335 [Candidatus Pedobacter colombiensis]|uniref:DUF4175 family protein n=1 Tax=Candidatus Pedobacter colombiensis TaxID=3121371 RepID=A0AAJ6B601_9SPHI|nr:DUF4175 family protein [Pedobacter sp.]WEK19322.1 MAG: hypothetical protein P0Y49_21335 [Pedobacter sp.]
MNNNYELLISKINEFTQKFYLNRLLRGSIYAATLLLGLYLLLFVLIYYANPGTITKTFLFFGYLAITIATITILIVKPALAYFKLGKNLSIAQASEIIGNHFFNVKDKLLNTLQLKAMADSSPENSQLIMAGIDQKIAELSPIPFSSAIRLGDNRKYIKYFLAPASVILLIALIAPHILKEGTSSFIQYNKEILPRAPFDFQLLTTNLIVAQGDDVALKLKLNGNEIPQEVYLSDGTNTYKLEKESNTTFNYTFKNLQKTQKIRFSAGGFNSMPFTIQVKPRPAVVMVTALLRYPSYLNKKQESIKNAGDLILPEGTHVTWELETRNSNRLAFVLGGKSQILTASNNVFSYAGTIHENSKYSIVPKNNFISSNDSLTHQLNVIKDEFPGILVTEAPDSLSSKALYFSGKVTDDHGFSSLKFKYNIKEKDKIKSTVSKSIAIKKGQPEDSFFFFWDLNEPLIKPGQTLEYYFEVADNDGVNGAKTTKSELKVYTVPSSQQVAEKISESSQALKQKMEKAIKLAGQVEKESKKLGETLLDKKQISFDDKKQIEQLLEKQKQLEQAVKEINTLNKKNTVEKEENNLLKQELADKQKKIDDLFNNVLDDKTKALLEKLQRLMDQNNKDQTQNELSKMQMDNKSLKNELDRILELYKQLEFEQNLQNKIDRLNELAKAQKELAKRSLSKDTQLEDLKSKQKELSKSFEELKKEIKNLDEKNQELERPNAFQSPEKEMKDIQQQQKNSEEQLSKNEKKSAAENQQKAAEKMEQQAKKMAEMQQESAEMENNLNAQELHRLLENLLKTSFDQEKVMLNLRRLNNNDPQYTTNVQKQREIKDNMKTIADSLFSLSKRVPQIETAVNEEMQKINFNIDKSLENLGERYTAAANKNQQYTMTSINNLSLMLNEALDQLQDMMKNSKSGGKGKKKQSMKQLQQMQQQLNNNMQKMRDQMQNGGNKGTVPKGTLSEEFAKMAQQQQMIREALQKINREENKDGKGGLGNLNQMVEDMKATESELVNKRLEQETMRRQKDLLTKLLDAENAQREQDQDAKRESKAGKDLPSSYKQMQEKFKAFEKNETEWLQKLPPNLNHYYKNKIAEYFKLLNSGQ